ncbi:cell filamentation protein Fic, partial [Streptococcus suis]
IVKEGGVVYLSFFFIVTLFDGVLSTLIIKVRDFIRTQLREFQYLDDNGQFKILPEYPEFAWFEGVVNAV